GSCVGEVYVPAAYTFKTSQPVGCPYTIAPSKGSDDGGPDRIPLRRNADLDSLLPDMRKLTEGKKLASRNKLLRAMAEHFRFARLVQTALAHIGIPVASDEDEIWARWNA